MVMKQSIAIIGEGETEWFYFEALRVAHRYPFKIAPSFPQHSDIPHMAKLAEECVRREYDYVVCLVDMDRLNRNATEMQTYLRCKKNSSSNVMWIETNPCTEFWFLLHFLPKLVVRHYESYEDCLPELRKYMPGYEKTKRYFMNTNLYTYLVENGSLERAISYADELSRLSEQTPEDEIAYSQIHKVFKLIQDISEGTLKNELKSKNRFRNRKKC